MIVYHGTSQIIEDKLSYARIGRNGTAKGYGFYFTTSRQEAEFYAIKWSASGIVYGATAEGRKELSLNKKTMSKRSLEKFYTSIAPLVLQNYSTIREAVNSEWDNETDSDIVNSTIQACGNVEAVLTTLYKILGYDHSIDVLDSGVKHYVALVPEAYTLSIGYNYSILTQFMEADETGDGQP